ncbi:hypothetical protein [Psittacicella melopsittaci]|nr:hypothetical protein [Psittacicella melopsittaci]
MPTHKLVFISREDNPQARDILSKVFNGKQNLHFKNLNDFRTYAQQNPQYIYDILQQFALTNVLDPQEYNQDTPDSIKLGFYLIFDDWNFVQDNESLLHITQMIKHHLDGNDVSTPQAINRTMSQELQQVQGDKIINVYILAEQGQLRSSIESGIDKFLTEAAGFEDVKFVFKEPVIRPQIPEVQGNEQNCLFINITQIPFAFLQFKQNTFGYLHVNEDFFNDQDRVDTAIQQLLTSLEYFVQATGNFNPLKFIIPEYLGLYAHPFDLSIWNQVSHNMAINPTVEKIVDNANLNREQGSQQIQVADPDNKNIILVFLGTNGSDDKENFVSRLQKFFNAFSAQCFVKPEEFMAQKSLFDNDNEAIYCFLDFADFDHQQICAELTSGFYVHLTDWEQIKDKNVYNMFVIFKNLIETNYYGHYINYKYPKNN